MAKLTEEERTELRNQHERDRAREHELRKIGLVAGVFLTIIALTASVIFSTIGALAPIGYISGTDLVITAVVIAVAVIFYFAIVYGRPLILKSKISATEQQLDLALGDDKKAEQ